MDWSRILAILGTAIASATPLIFAVMGETLTELAGVINLATEGTIMLAALASFAVAKSTNSLLLGFGVAALVGAIVAFVLALGSITLRQSQIAIGFVLTLLCSDLSSFLGSAFARVPGPTVPGWAFPLLQDLPILGPLFFQSDGLVYLSYGLVIGTWVYVYQTYWGLQLRSLGEHPNAAFVRGIPIIPLRYFYTLWGGALIGMAGAAFSLDFKAGWSHRHTAGYGWIALAIVIFGGWNPLRAALGVYLFGILQVVANQSQATLLGIPTQVVSLAPFVVMLLVLVITSGEGLERSLQPLPLVFKHPLLRVLKTSPPEALGKHFDASRSS